MKLAVVATAAVLSIIGAAAIPIFNDKPNTLPPLYKPCAADLSPEECQHVLEEHVKKLQASMNQTEQGTVKQQVSETDDEQEPGYDVQDADE